MRRTATHLLGSPNAAQLEMRILANHGADSRFAFLKGRWSRSWRSLKARARADQAKEEEKANSGIGALGGLAGYGDSDEESSNPSVGEGEAEGQSVSTVSLADDSADGQDVVKAARRARAKQWAESRRATKEDGAKPT